MTVPTISQICSVSDCSRPVRCKTLCHKHYQRWRKYGDPNRFINTKEKAEMFGGGFIQRFWSRICKTDECWLWTGATNGNGYGVIVRNGRQEGTHRISFELAYGRKPTLDVLHSCDNPPCVNPDHLREGTFSDNMQDKIARGRAAKGASLPQSKLTPNKVRQTRMLLKAGKSYTEIAAIFRVSPAAIFHIARGRSWKHVI